MDGVDVWASHLTQLMAKRKPEDTWELVSVEDLTSDHLDSSSFQYQLRGLSRLQCGRCPTAWSSAHVHILFHLRWDRDSHLGLVKMRVWTQACQLRPLDVRADCHVSLLNVRLFLNRLVLFILRMCYQESTMADQCPEVGFGDHCEACKLGVCFLQKAPDPAWGLRPGVPSPIQVIPTLDGSLLVSRALGSDPFPVFGPLSDINLFFSEDSDIVTLLFMLVCSGRDKDCPGYKTGSQSETSPRGLVTVETVSTNPLNPSTSRALPVIFMDPILPGEGHLLSRIKSFQVKGHISTVRSSIDVRVKGPGIPRNEQGPNGCVTLPLPYILCLTEHGEGSLTFPSLIAKLMQAQDTLLDVDHPVHFHFTYLEKKLGLAEQGSDFPRDDSSILKGVLTIPFSVFSMKKDRGLQRRSYDRNRPRARRARSRSGEDFLEEEDGWLLPRTNPPERLWVGVFTVFCVLLVLCLPILSGAIPLSHL